MASLKEALVSSENAGDEQEAEQLMREMRNRVYDGEDPEEILYEYGLEPDYVLDLLF